MSNRSKKLPPVAFLPSHVLIPPVPPPGSLRAHQLASEAAGFGISTMIANRMLVDDRKPAAVSLKFLQVEGMDCRTFYDSKDKNPKILFGFLVGVSAKEELGLKMTFSLDRPPFSNKKREFKPTSKIMQQEVIRRSSLQGVSRMPRPAQWSTEKLHEALSVRYPPKLTVEDIKFLRAACKEIYDHAMKRNKEELSGNESCMEKSIRWTKDEGWKNPKSMLRLYHVLVDLRELFVIRNLTEVASAKDFWTTAAKCYNNEAWVPSTAIIPKLEGFKQSTPLPLITKKVTGSELAIIFRGIKPKLRDLVDEWNTSFLPTEMLKENEIVEQWDYAALANRLESREGVEGHVMYLWEFANNNQILGSCMMPSDAEPETSEEPENLTVEVKKDNLKQAPTEMIVQEVDGQEHDERYDEESEEEVESLESVKVVTVHGATVPEPTIEESAIQELVIQQPVIQQPAIQKPAIQEDLDTQYFTTSQELNFEYLRVYNLVETELCELEVKAVLAKTREERKLYQQFSWRKKKVLEALRCHLERSTHYVSRLSQSLGEPPVEVADLPEPKLDDEDFPFDDTNKLPSITKQPKFGTKRSSSNDDRAKGRSSYDGSAKQSYSNNTLPFDEMEEEPTEEDTSSNSNATKKSSSEEDAHATISEKGSKRKTIQEIIDQAEEEKTGVGKEGGTKKSRKTEGKGVSAQKGEEAVYVKKKTVKANDEGEDVENEPATEVSKKTESPRKTNFQKSVKTTTPTKEADEKAGSQRKKSQRDSPPKKKGSVNPSPPKKKGSTTLAPRTKRAFAADNQEDSSRRASRRSQAEETPPRRISSRCASSSSKSEESSKKKRRTK